MEDSPQRRFATQWVRHTNVTENLSLSVEQMFATASMWKIRHTTVTGWGRGGVGVRGLRSGQGGLGRVGNPPTPIPDPTSPTSRPQSPRPQTPNPYPLTSTPLPQPPDSNLSQLCGESSTSALLQMFV